jgi:small neutral amino acid transporter SnatA (MarC family)
MLLIIWTFFEGLGACALASVEIESMPYPARRSMTRSVALSPFAHPVIVANHYLTLVLLTVEYPEINFPSWLTIQGLGWLAPVTCALSARSI